MAKYEVTEIEEINLKFPDGSTMVFDDNIVINKEEDFNMNKNLTDEELMEMMESQMTYSWEELDKFLDSISGAGFTRSDTYHNLRGQWLKNKLPLFKALGNQVRIEREVELALTDSDIKKAIRSFVGELIKNPEMTDTTIGLVMLVTSMVSNDSLTSNRFEDNFEVLDLKFSKGMKVSRALGQLTKDDKEKYLIQTEFSKITQTFKAVGNLVVSIDPTDILMMSFNPDSEWRSCHNIVDGEFRAGAVTYAVDSSTFIAYAYRRKAETYGGLEIPNKLWRQIGYFSDSRNNIALSTHYPSDNKSNEETAIKIFKEIYPNAEHDNVDADYLSFPNVGGYHYNDLVNGRSEECTFIDLFGTSSEDEVSMTSHARGEEFSVGIEYVPSPFGGYIEDSECID